MHKEPDFSYDPVGNREAAFQAAQDKMEALFREAWERVHGQDTGIQTRIQRELGDKN
jgi:hypothetical protein